jgi:hypothetical protein
MTFISKHSVIICVVLPWRTYEMHPALSLKSGVTIPQNLGCYRPIPLKRISLRDSRLDSKESRILGLQIIFRVPRLLLLQSGDPI